MADMDGELQLLDGVLGSATMLANSSGNQVYVRMMKRATLVSLGMEYFGKWDNSTEAWVARLSVPHEDVLSWTSGVQDDVKMLVRSAATAIDRQVDRLQIVPMLASPNWREQLGDVIDFGISNEGGSWPLIDEKLVNLKSMNSRAVTSEDFNGLAAAARQIMIAAVNLVWNKSMVPDGEVLPMGDDFSAKFDQILGPGDRRKKLKALMKASMGVISKTVHSRSDVENPDPVRDDELAVDAFAVTQATVICVRILEKLDKEING